MWFNLYMRISPIKFYTPTFKAHSYKIEPKNCDLIIQTDNNPYLGEKPYLVYERFGEPEAEMENKNGLYSAKATSAPWKKDFKYHIKYQDTGALDLKDGKEYSFSFDELRMDAIAALRKQHRQPMVHAFKSGSGVGKLLYKDIFDYNEIEKNINEPSIVVCKRIASDCINNPNVVGLILLSDDTGTLAHSGAMLRNSTKISAAVYDPKVIKQLQALDGENVEIKLKNDYIKFNKSDKRAIPNSYPQIEVPRLKYSDKILTSKEYSPDLVGAKAYNLRRLEELVESGKIDVKIPKSVALTHGYIQKMFDENKEQQISWEEMGTNYYECKEAACAPYRKNQSEAQMLDLIETLKANDINCGTVMVRSAFNGEDLPDYSAAGIYRSDVTCTEPVYLYSSIIDVAQSKWEQQAISSREKHGIPDEAIQPSVILQKYIEPDYKFTLYTDFDDNKMRIEMYSDEAWSSGNAEQPNVFTYDKTTGKLTYDSVQLCEPYASYDENLNPLPLEPMEYDLSGKPEVFELVRKLVDNALVVEKEFGAPQDIEGGFLGNEIYLWQTRNIPSANDLSGSKTKFLDARLSPEILTVKQNYLKNPTPETYKAFEDTIFKCPINSNMRVLPHELSNKIFVRNYPLDEKYIKIKERLHLFDKFLEYNPEDKVNNSNPIDITSVFKTLLAENNCNAVKMNGLEILKDVLMGDNTFDVYYALEQLIKYAQQHSDNKNISLSFERDGALYAKVTYKGKELQKEDFYKAIPAALSYEDLEPITASSNGDFASIKLRLNTVDAFFYDTMTS